MILISDPKVTAVPIKECGDPLVDIKTYPEFIISQKHAKIYEGFTYVRKMVAEKLRNVSLALPKGIQIIFEEGHRPLSVQKKIFDEYYVQLKEKFPEWENEKIWVDCTKFVAAPQGTPPHSTGGAVDISLADETGKELDMGSVSDDTPDENENRNFTEAPNISEEAKKNRKMFISLLEKEGFVNYPAEWWHWSYGDQYWAFVRNEKNAIFASKEMPHFKSNLNEKYRNK